jgi:purine catabolism regulator
MLVPPYKTLASVGYHICLSDMSFLCKNDNMARLSEVLAAAELDLKIVTSSGVDPEIRWVSTTELIDLSPYLEGGEIVLTTGLSLTADDPRWLDFVSGLSRAQAAAIGFAVGVNHEQTPPALIQAASAYRVALFEVPRPTPFIAVSKAVADLVGNDELARARRALSTQRHILNQAFSSQGTPGVLARLSIATESDAAVLRSDGSVESATAGMPIFDELLAAVKTLATDNTRAALGASDPDRAWLVHPLGLQGVAHRFLAVCGSKPPTPSQQGAITAATIVLSLEDSRQRAEQNSEHERRERIASLFLQGEAVDASAAFRVLWPEMQLPERVRVAIVQGDADFLSAFANEAALGVTQTRLIARAETMGEHPSEWPRVALICDAENDDEVQRVINLALANSLNIVIGREVELERTRMSWMSASAKLNERGDVVGIATTTPSVVWADHGAPVIEALSSLAAADLHKTVLGPLAEAEPEMQLLRETLKAFLAHNGQSGPAATALGVHRNTLRHRLDRIEQLTNRSLLSADNRAELWIALRLADQ